jgi:hypothetical protein
MPSFIGKEAAAMQSTTYDFIMNCDVDIRKDLYDNMMPLPTSCCLVDESGPQIAFR